MSTKKIFCVIPAYNEEETILEVIEKVNNFVDKIIIVDDCSSDKTVDMIRNDSNLYLLRHIINRGQGAALKTGTEYAIKEGADIIVHFDADGQFLAEDIEVIAGPITKGEAAIVFGSRFLEEKSDIPILKKNFIMPLARLVNRLFLGIKLTDPQSGFRAFSAETAKRIDWQQDRMAHCSEILFEAAKSGLVIKEVPITVIYHNFGQKFSGGLKILKELMLGALLR